MTAATHRGPPGCGWRSLAQVSEQCWGFIFFGLFSNLGDTGCRRGRTPERPLRQPPKVWPMARPFVVSGPAQSFYLEIPRLPGQHPTLTRSTRHAYPSTSHAAWDVDAVHGLHAMYSLSSLGTARRLVAQMSQIDIANCCSREKFRLTVDLGSFPFRYKRAGVERRGKNSEHQTCRWDRVSVRRAPLDGALAGTVPGEAEVGNHRISLVSVI
jgi:hypothetical protein